MTDRFANLLTIDFFCFEQSSLFSHRFSVFSRVHFIQPFRKGKTLFLPRDEINNSSFFFSVFISYPRLLCAFVGLYFFISCFFFQNFVFFSRICDFVRSPRTSSQSVRPKRLGILYVSVYTTPTREPWNIPRWIKTNDNIIPLIAAAIHNIVWWAPTRL